jgi:survival of motor neuron protein-interacting protein 1
MDASEYLARVSQQAKRMPDIFVSSSSLHHSEKKKKQKRDHVVPIEGSAASLSYFFSARASLVPPPSRKHLPSTISSTENDVSSWTEQVISNFDRLRQYLENCKAHGVGGKQTNRMSLPPMKESASWHTFCCGTDEANGNTGAYFGDDDDDDVGEDDDDLLHDTTDKIVNGDNTRKANNQEDINGGTAVEETTTPPRSLWKAHLPQDGYAPTVRLLLQMDQVMIRKVLSHLTHFVHMGWSVTSGRRSEWIYALLARLEKPIHRDDAAVLFGLLKELCLARSKINVDSVAVGVGDGGASVDDAAGMKLATLNVLITLIGIYFEQGGGVGGVMTCRS